MGQIMLTKGMTNFVGRVDSGVGFEMGSTFQPCVEDMNKSFKSSDTIVRVAALKCLAELAEGAGVSGRFVHTEILKVIKSAASVTI